MKVQLLFGVMLLTGTAFASGHGPVFGMTTPTNAKGGWSLDLGVMGRSGAANEGLMSRAMLSYGVTQDVQLSFTVPYVFSSAPLAPARTTSMMSSTPDFEGIGAWRFHREGTSVGTRFETTAYAGLIVPGPQRPRGMLGNLSRAPGVYTAISSGVASRSHYAWIGVGNTHFAERNGDQRPNLFSYSAVWAYRPKAWRKDYPHWDWRFFAELTGELSNKVLMDGARMPGTGGHQIFLGPTVLGIYKNYAIEGGVQFPVFRDVGASFQREQFRYSINISYFF
ncbi:MAG: hypothetical protein L0Z53_05305 [Acidobacteriales bacterium]|nr:hypothetical protein [Terriglobales bacterium]